MIGRVIAMVAALANLTAVTSAKEWRVVTPPVALELPRDHGAHFEYRSEWWYVTGIVGDASGRRLGYQLTFFRRGLDPEHPQPQTTGLRAAQVLAAHLAVADSATGKLTVAQRTRRVAAGLASASETDMDIRLEEWRLERLADGSLRIQAGDLPRRLAFDLTLRPDKPLVVHCEGAVSRKGPEAGNASVYLTWTRLATTGVVEVAGQRLAVTGSSWLDHEWGSSQLGAGLVGWDWLGLRLADGRDLMVYRLRLADGTASPFSSGTLVATDGSTRPLGAADFSLAETSAWVSPRSSARYPGRVHLTVPAAGIDLQIVPLVADAEIDGRASTGVVYWEGPVAVTGSDVGEGYMELTGYATSLANRL